ncbi:MAG: metal-sulfur cluster assembly factor [Patescibacteria group bacterium]|nr:metal-sulfur cluster assembly factor [Patescibacteria group bacterium]
MGVTQKQVEEKLKEVLDPEIGISILDLGLVYEIKIDGDDVSVLMTLTTPGCPMAAMFDQEVIRKVKEIKNVKKVKVEITFDPPWTPEKMTKEAKEKLKMP